MGIYKVKDRRGRRRYVVSKYWLNESGRRMYAPNYRSAQALQTLELRLETRPWSARVTVRPSRDRSVGRHPRRSDHFPLGCCQA